MWNRRDLLVLATTAVATFGLTLVAFYPRTVQAVGEAEQATTEVKQPTLHVGSVSITAAMDPKNDHTVILTLINAGDAEFSAQFVAQAAVAPSSSPLSRSLSIPREVWKEEYALNLGAGETKTISIALPDNAFVVAPQAKPEDNDPKQAFLRATPGYSVLTLRSTGEKPQAIQALMLPKVQPAESTQTTTVAKADS
jgi:hypothetical protein